MEIKEIAIQYEEVIGPIIHRAEPPTPQSIERIESELELRLPKSLVKFATLAPNYGNWFASLGADFDSLTHILAINRDLRADGTLPENYVAINVGYDDDYDCIDGQTFDAESGEYLITYWSPDLDPAEGEIYRDFPSYLLQQIDGWRQTI